MECKYKRALIVTNHYLNGVGGGVFASRAYINAFACIFEKIILLCPANEGDDINKFRINESVNIIPVCDNNTLFRKILNLCIGRVNRFHNVFEAVLEKYNFDVVVFDNSRASSGLLSIAHRYVSKVITIHHNYEYNYIKDNMSGIIRLLLLYWTKKYEKNAVRESDLNVTLTEYDKRKLNQIYNKGNKAKIENIGCFEYEKRTFKNEFQFNPKTFLITGNLSAKQTIDSLNYWIDNYYPVLQKLCPNYKLIIAGKGPGKCLINKCIDNNIVVIPSPASMDDILEKSEYYICPISKGGGIKLRMMDGLRFGLPVVCHEVSARGYESMVKQGYVVSYNTVKSFKSAVEKILLGSYNRNKIVSEYNKYFSFESGISRLKQVINESL
ncbi:glycosyltransferase [Barnesiella viscericola]|uniref:glycosyltransferase n=1 Tax=Barnesiella viscericola TaxID=397865 RepID=UPI00255C2377|nr:glycosyltransferase [Barnesiella viscericola]